ncbi:MAG: nucleoside phosphorylase [Acidobacteriaceae bacterium]
MSSIAIIAAMPGELKPLVRGWQPRGRNIWGGRIADCEAVAIVGGMGAAAAARAMERIFAEANPDVLVSCGWAGALTCAVKPGAACVISEIVDAKSGERFPTRSADGYRLVTLDRVALVDEKRALAAKHQSVLVDMEAATVARMAAARGLDFYCFKGISDGYTDRLPDFSRFISGEGELRTAALLAYAATRPGYWASLWRLGKSSSAAAVAVADLMKKRLAKSV